MAKRARFRYCLNTSTISGQKLPLPEMVDIASKAGYDAIEPWIREIEEYVRGGGKTKDLARRIRDRGLSVESSIGFAEWIVDDETRRAKGLENLWRDMKLAAEIGAKRIAAPPAGAQDAFPIDLRRVAERYREILKIGDKTGVTPMIEVWGFSKNLTRLGDAIFGAVESGHPKACILTDIYHLHKGGSGHDGYRFLSGSALPVIHVNDYPAEPPRETITDAHRVYPGDGVAPLKRVFRDLAAIGFDGHLSLELFNPDYWKQDALGVAKTGLKKTQAAVAKALR